MAKRTLRAAKNTVTIPWSQKEEGGGGRFRIPEGSYGMDVESVVSHESDENEGLKWTFIGTEGKAKGKKFYLYTMFTPGSLWKLEELCKALGRDVPDEDEDADLDEFVGCSITGVVQDDTYQGKISSKLVDFETGEEEEEEETTTRGKKNGAGKKKKKTKVSADEVKAMDEDELEDVIKDYELDVDLSEFKTPRRKAGAVVAALEETGALAE